MKQEKVWYKDPKNCSLIGQQQVKSLWNLLRLEGYKDCTGNHRENRYHGTYFQIKPNRKSGRGGVWSGTRRRTRGRGTSSNISVGITNRTPNSTGWQSASPYRSRSTRIINIYIYMIRVQRYSHSIRCSSRTCTASGSCSSRRNRGSRYGSRTGSRSSDGSTDGERRRLGKYLSDIVNGNQENGILLTANKFSSP